MYVDLVSLIFGTTIPTSSNILMKCFLHFTLCGVDGYFLRVCINCLPERAASVVNKDICTSVCLNTKTVYIRRISTK